MADKYFDDLRGALDRFSECVDKELDEIRQQKAEMQSMKMDVKNLMSGRYVRDESRVIISAPEIVIGNVDQNGMLKASAGQSHVVIRANTIDIEGVGDGGSTAGGAITQRASMIQQIAVDPGLDGVESVVGERSQIVSQARSIVLCSANDNGEFVADAVVPQSGVSITSETELNLVTAPSVESKTTTLKTKQDGLKALQKELKEDVKAKKKAVDVLFDAMNICLEKQESLPKDTSDLYANMADIELANKQFDTLKQALPTFLNDYMLTVSRLAETNRRLSVMDDAKKVLDDQKPKFKDKTTGAAVNIKGEQINLISTDGDGNMRTNDEASINMQAQTVNITSLNGREALMEKSSLNVNTHTIGLSTADNRVKDEKNWENPAVGDINIVTKNMTIEALDYETKDSKEQLKNHTKDGKLKVRVETVELMAVDKDGKANGRVSVNAKAIEIKSMDVDKEKLTDKQMAASSTMVLASEKMYGGMVDDKNKAKQVQISGEKIGVIAKTTAEVSQDKAVVQLDGGNVSVGGSKPAIFGDLTVNGKSEFKGDVKAGKATIDNVEAKSSFKSKSISDGIAVPSVAASSSLSAKIKEENPPKSENK